MKNSEALKILKKYEAKSSHPQLPIVWKHAIGSKVYTDKKEYIDFTSGIFVVNAGHSAISRYLIDQIDKGLIYSYTYPTKIKAKLIKKLIDITPKYLEKVALASTGAEATEMACKLMRLAQGDRKGIIAFKGAMHGKTWLTDVLTNKLPYGGKPFLSYPIDFPADEEEFDEYKFSQKLLNAKASGRFNGIGGIIIESYRGWDAKFLPISYVQALVKWCRKNDILVCFDEVQGGFWRTGKLFAYEHYEVKPDLVCMGKGLGGGVPISAVMGKAKILDLSDDLTATFSGNPLCCAGALGNLIQLDRIDKKHIEIKSNFLRGSLLRFKANYPEVINVSRKGLLGAITFKDTKSATKVCKLAEEKGLLVVYTARNSVKIGPPLTISMDELTEGLKKLEDSIKELI